MNGGYLMIFKNDSDIYAKAQKALVLGKPILFYENATTCYYIDTISGGEITTEIVDDEEVFTYGDVILTKGGKTITITYENVVTETGNIQQTTENFDALMENIVDSAGNKRFIEFDGTTDPTQGLNGVYVKASLSGTHLMFVCAGNMENGTALTAYSKLFEFTVPDYIYNKIVPVWGSYIEAKGFVIRDEDGGNTTTIQTALYKAINNKIQVWTLSTMTLTSLKVFRFQFDLLIDSEYSE